ncbi:MAG: hypothetical protein DU489_08550 [Nitrosomonas sp.]
MATAIRLILNVASETIGVSLTKKLPVVVGIMMAMAIFDFVGAVELGGLNIKYSVTGGAGGAIAEPSKNIKYAVSAATDRIFLFVFINDFLLWF